jgi:hypothetical protein
VSANPDNMLVLGQAMKNCMEWVARTRYLCFVVPARWDPDTKQFILKQTGCKSLVRTAGGALNVRCQSVGDVQLCTVILVDGVDAPKGCRGWLLEVLSYAKVEAAGLPREAKHNPPARTTSPFATRPGRRRSQKARLLLTTFSFLH